MKKKIAIAGAGPVGALLSIYLIKRGYDVTIFERRHDERQAGYLAGRSINMALSNRGIRALNEVGVIDEFERMAIPMKGRLMHDLQANLTFQPYGLEDQCIYSVSRSDLNIALINRAEQEGVSMLFNHKIIEADWVSTNLVAEKNGEKKTHSFDYIFGADGAYSAIRGSFQTTDRFNYAQTYIEHGYKEFYIPPGEGNSFRLEKNALHIWPRTNYMLIALPNPDGSFTCTLFFPFEGTPSFQSINSVDQMSDFLKNNFRMLFN